MDIELKNGQICDGYNKKSLMGNWYEERWAPQQPFRKQFEYGQKRNFETDICYPTNKGTLKPLARINRNPKWNTDGVTPNDQYYEFRSIYHTEYDRRNLDNYNQKKINNVMKMTGRNSIYSESCPNTMIVQSQKQRNVVEEYNMGRVIKDNEKRPVYQNTTDFASTFNKHPENYEKFYQISENKASYSRPMKADPSETVKHNEQKVAGCSKSMREPLNDIIEKITRGAQFDNANSISLGEGEYEWMRKYTNDGEYRHIRQDVTQVMNKPLTKK